MRKLIVLLVVLGVLISGQVFAQSTTTSTGSVNGFSVSIQAQLPANQLGTVTKSYNQNVTIPGGYNANMQGTATVTRTPGSYTSTGSNSIVIKK